MAWIVNSAPSTRSSTSTDSPSPHRASRPAAYSRASAWSARWGPITLTPLPPVSPEGLTATGVAPKWAKAASSSDGEVTTRRAGAASGATSSSRERAKALFHSISAPALVGPTAAVPWARRASMTPAARGSSALTIATSTSLALAKAATAAGSQTSPTRWLPPESAACRTIEGFSWPTKACSSLCSAMRSASALSRPPWPTISVRTGASLDRPP